MKTTHRTLVGIAWAAMTVVIGGAVDLYLVTLADSWMALSIGAIGSVASLPLLFVPKFLHGALLGWIAYRLAKSVAPSPYRSVVLVGFIVYFGWKFFAVEIWVAPEPLAYVLAVGPYVAFFVGFGLATLFGEKGSPFRRRATAANGVRVTS